MRIRRAGGGRVLAAIVLSTAALARGAAPQQAPEGPWRQYASPTAAGFSVEGLERARRYADSVRSGAVMAIHRGIVLAAWGDVGRELELHSVRKSLVSAMYGVAVADGRIRLDQTLGELALAERTPLTEGEQRARIRDLLAARSGVYLPAAYAGAEQDRERPARGSAAPGTRFSYNNWDFNVLGVIYEQLTGDSLYAAFDRRIAQPLGMEDYQRSDGFLVYEPSSSLHPAHTFRMSARDLARFGQLYLQRGRWTGKQIVSEEWVVESTRPKSELGDGRGYGFLWWTYAAGSLGSRYPTLNRMDVFAGSGTGGQYLAVVPAADMVIVHRGDTDNGRQVPGRDVWMIAEMILAARRGAPQPAPGTMPLAPLALTTQAPPRTRVRFPPLDSAAMTAYVGEYQVSPQVTVRVFVYRGRLFANFPGRGEAELLRVGADDFTIMPIPGAEIRFARDTDGRVRGMVAEVGGERLRAERR
jgi:CubicO group peptidase (beta-lactamase class C family)